MKREGVENIEGPSPSLEYMFATRSIVHVVETCTRDCMYNTVHVQYLPVANSFLYTLYILENLLNSWQLEQNWQTGKIGA